MGYDIQVGDVVEDKLAIKHVTPCTGSEYPNSISEPFTILSSRGRQPAPHTTVQTYKGNVVTTRDLVFIDTWAGVPKAIVNKCPDMAYQAHLNFGNHSFQYAIPWGFSLCSSCDGPLYPNLSGLATLISEIISGWRCIYKYNISL